MKDINGFSIDVMKGFLQGAKREITGIDNFYNGYRRLLENQRIIKPEYEEDVKIKLEILERAYTLFCDEDAREILNKKGVTAEYIIEKYGERILGQYSQKANEQHSNDAAIGGNNKRTYDMSEMFNQGLIQSISDTKGLGKLNNVMYISKQETEYEVFDKTGSRITIQKVGTLHYKTTFGITKDISQYRITKKTNNGQYQVKVFSSIVILKLDNEKYKAAVLNELLSEENIQLSNAAGYIGTIEDSDVSLEKGEEEKEVFRYAYKIDDTYSIVYDAEDLSAVGIYKQKAREDMKSFSRE